MMNKKYLVVLSTLILVVSLPVSAHVGINADHSRIKNLVVHLMGFDHLAFVIGLGLCVYMGGQLIVSMMVRLTHKKSR